MNFMIIYRLLIFVSALCTQSKGDSLDLKRQCPNRVERARILFRHRISNTPEFMHQNIHLPTSSSKSPAPSTKITRYCHSDKPNRSCNERLLVKA